MDRREIALAGATLTARASGALWWAAERLLCVADMHLGKTERMARRGGALLPPYATAETLARLAAEIGRLDPRRVVCLGDSFDDGPSAAAIDGADAARLAALMAGRDWIWIAGNHDPLPPMAAGRSLPELALGPLTFRHAAAASAAPGEVSGHYHPRLRLALRGASVRRGCFLLDSRRLILPAFGAYTGGLDAEHPALRALLDPPVQAILIGDPCVALPLPGEVHTARSPRIRAL